MAKRKERPKGRKRTTAKRVSADKQAPKVPTVSVKPEEDEGGYGEDGLKQRWRLFVDAYTGPAGGNATKAAEMAGYAAANRNALSVTAHRLLRNAKVAQAIAAVNARRRLTPDWVKARLAELANADMNNFLTVDEDGQPKLDLKKAEAEGAIGQIKEFDAERGKLKLYDPTRALSALAKMFGTLSERHEHGGIGGGPVQVRLDASHLTEDELRQLLQIHDALAARSRATLPSGN